jgi:hypothetical protein
MRLFVGSGIGQVYNHEEIEAVRVLRRRLGRDLADCINADVFLRCEEILDEWKRWGKNKIVEASRSGYADARRADLETFEVYEGITSLLARTQALTVEGLFAKARVFESVFPAPEYLASSIREGLEKLGVGDEDAIALSLTRDILVLARGKEAAQ